MRAEPHQVIQDSRNLGKHYANILRTNRHLNTQQLFNCQTIGMLIAHHGHIIEPIHVWQCLNESFVFSQFLRCAMQQANMRIGAFNHFAVQLQHQSQHPVRRRVLGAEIQRVILDFRHLSHASV